MVIDHGTDPSAPTGKFECIFRQKITSPCYGVNSDLAVKGHSLKLDYFYRGEEFLSDPGIHAERDITSMMNKVKQACLRKFLRQQSNKKEITQEKAIIEILKDESFEENKHNTLTTQESILSEQINTLFKNIEESVNSNKPLPQPPEGPPPFAPKLKQPPKKVTQQLPKPPAERLIKPTVATETTPTAKLASVVAPIKSYSNLSAVLKKTLEIEALPLKRPPLACNPGRSDNNELTEVTKIFEDVINQLNDDDNHAGTVRQRPNTKSTKSEQNIDNATIRFLKFLDKKEREYRDRK